MAFVFVLCVCQRWHLFGNWHYTRIVEETAGFQMGRIFYNLSRPALPSVRFLIYNFRFYFDGNAIEAREWPRIVVAFIPTKAREASKCPFHLLWLLRLSTLLNRFF